MEAQGTLEKVVHSKWATPIVVVPKSDGRYRICGNFEVTLNPILSVDLYPFPKPQDIFAILAGGKNSQPQIGPKPTFNSGWMKDHKTWW